MINIIWKIFKIVFLFIIIIIAIPLDYIYWNGFSIIIPSFCKKMTFGEIVKDNWRLYKEYTGIKK